MLILLLTALTFTSAAAKSAHTHTHKPPESWLQTAEPNWVRLVPKSLNRKLNEVIDSIAVCHDLNVEYEREEGVYHDAADARETALAQWRNDHPGQTEAQLEREDVADHEVFVHYQEVKSRQDSNRKKLFECLKPEIEGKVISTWAIFSEPSEKSKKIGSMEVTLDLKEVRYARLKFAYQPARGAKTHFTPDMSIPCEYDGLYHTVLARKGDWLQFPQVPFRKPVWVKFDKAWGPVEVVKIKELEAVTLALDGHKDRYLAKKVKDGQVFLQPYRPDEDADDKTPLKEIPIKSLYDGRHHLLVQKAFIDGC